MHAFACQRIEIDWHHRHQSLSFSGLHLSDCPSMQDNTSQQLDIVRYHIPDLFFSFYIYFLSQHPFTSLFDGSKSFRQNVVKGSSLTQSGLKFLSFGFDLIVRKCFIFIIKSIDSGYHRQDLIDLLEIIISGNKFQNIV